MSQINHNKFILPPHQFRGFRPKTRVAEANAASVQKERGYWVREWASTCGQSKPSLAGRGPCQCTLRRQQAECPADGTWTTASVRRLLLLPLPTVSSFSPRKTKATSSSHSHSCGPFTRALSSHLLFPSRARVRCSRALSSSIWLTESKPHAAVPHHPHLHVCFFTSFSSSASQA